MTGYRPLLGLLLLLALTGGCARPAATPAQPPADLLFVIPAGTAAARMRGEAVVTIPASMTLMAGQGITIRNEDQAMHYFFYAPIAPGQTFRKVFGEPGRYGYSGFLSCSVAEYDSVTVEVAPRP